MNHQEAYKLLQLSPSSTDKEIKQAYRKYAMLYHPDRNHNSNAYQKFIDISEAYELLSNKQNIYVNPKPKNHKQRSKFRSSEHKYRNYQSYNSKKENERSERARQRYENEFSNQSNELYAKIYSQYKNSIKRKLTVYFAIIGIIISSLFTADFFTKTEKIYVNPEHIYVQFHNNFVTFEYQNEDFYLSINNLQLLQNILRNKDNRYKILIEKTSLLNNTLGISFYDNTLKTETIYINKESNILFWLPLILFLMIIPALSIIFERPSFNFVFFIINYNMYAFPFIVVFIIWNAMPIIYS